ncbi:MAG: hypothetical protein KA350_02220 [Arenimonas sp.]|nr:hypothetical protein [Arenimonas sp.]
MSRLTLGLSVFVMVLVLGACGKKESESADTSAEQVAITAPANDDSNAWKAYLGQVAAKSKYQAVVTDSTIPYFLPANSKVEDNVDANAPSSPYSRQMEMVKPAIERTVSKGQLLVFGSPDSAAMADFIIEAFTGASPVAVKGSTVLFVGKSADAERVKPVVVAAGGNFVVEEIP